MKFRFAMKRNYIYIGFHCERTEMKLTFVLIFWTTIPVDIYLLKVSNRKTRIRCEIYSKLTIKTPERRQWRHSGIFIVNFEHISHFVLVIPLLTLNTLHMRWCILSDDFILEQCLHSTYHPKWSFVSVKIAVIKWNPRWVSFQEFSCKQLKEIDQTPNWKYLISPGMKSDVNTFLFLGILKKGFCRKVCLFRGVNC